MQNRFIYMSLLLAVSAIMFSTISPVGATTIVDFNDLVDMQFVGHPRYTGLTFSTNWRAANMSKGRYDATGYPPHSTPIQVWTGAPGEPTPWSHTGIIDFTSAHPVFDPVFEVDGWICAGQAEVNITVYDLAGFELWSTTVLPNYGSSTYFSYKDTLGEIKTVYFEGTDYWFLDDFSYTKKIAAVPEFQLALPVITSLAAAICITVRKRSSTNRG